MELLYFSRGRGKGHAVPDLAISRDLRRLMPRLEIQFVSHASGAEVFRAAKENVLDLEMPENNSFVDTLVAATKIIATRKPCWVVSHEEMAVLPASHIAGIRSTFLTHWFPFALDPYIRSLAYADEVIFMEEKGLFHEPAEVTGRVSYAGPVLRTLRYRKTDRGRLREDLGFGQDDTIILYLPGTPSEASEPAFDLAVEAFTALEQKPKRMICVVGADREELAKRAGGRSDIIVKDVDWSLDALMAASDVAVTKGTYNITRELNALGIPSICLSRAKNPIDDLYARRSTTNTFLWTQEMTAERLKTKLEVALSQDLGSGCDYALADGSGAGRVANLLSKSLNRSELASV